MDELKPTSFQDTAIAIGEEYLSQVRTFGALGYSPQRICNLLGLTGKKKFGMMVRITIPGDTYFNAYHSGIAMGDYNIDAELAKHAETGDIDSITALAVRKNERIERDLRKELFGV